MPRKTFSNCSSFSLTDWSHLPFAQISRFDFPTPFLKRLHRLKRMSRSEVILREKDLMNEIGEKMNLTFLQAFLMINILTTFQKKNYVEACYFQNLPSCSGLNTIGFFAMGETSMHSWHRS
uniref:Uncharacterized protein n=1 Tax=Proboscia inermis TaxID=420281 RepID=A0A7S0CF00_9STRA|mmetsp:Transcript_44349/g.44874  ORF Transcript_44349/g.44874 Transcript_44349/m.44874 type:complete len:121 (+) Transcript_44349:227-589(+)